MERKKEFKFYETPVMEVVDVRMEGVFCMSPEEPTLDLGTDPTTPVGPGGGVW